MNEQDSAQMKSLLESQGYEFTTEMFDADFILINTCSIREKAVHKIYSDLGRIRPYKEINSQLVVAITGCVAEQEKEKLTRRFSYLDLVIGPDHISQLPQLVADVYAKRKSTPDEQQIVKTGFLKRNDFEFVNILPADDESPVKAFVNIQKGCDNICSFCIVPFVRGREVSRSHHEIISEINQLVERGVKEVMLLGQNVNSYGLKNTGDITFAELLGEIADKTKLQRLRFTTSHPKDVGDDLVEQFRSNPILAPWFHLPIQSGSNRILKAMRRQYTREFYLEMVAKLREAKPDMAFSTDIIVGFPGETEDEFQETLSVMKIMSYDSSFSFVYSARPYTSAVELPDDVPLSVKRERLKRLQALDKELVRASNEKCVGSTQDILVESFDELNVDYPFMGRTGTNKIVHFAGEAVVGDFSKVAITQANPYSLYGTTDIVTQKAS